VDHADAEEHPGLERLDRRRSQEGGRRARRQGADHGSQARASAARALPAGRMGAAEGSAPADGDVEARAVRSRRARSRSLLRARPVPGAVRARMATDREWRRAAVRRRQGNQAMSAEKRSIQAPPPEAVHAAELAFLAAWDAGDLPPGWVLTPR